MNSILEKIAGHKALEVAAAKKKNPLNTTSGEPIRDFTSALNKKNPAIIAEIKKASPSKGIIREDFDVANIATTYEKYGACCLSVLTDQHFFKGDPTYLLTAKQHTKLPVLRKDFIIDTWQVNESLVLGADCILLIAALLDDHQLHDFCQQAQELGMAVLVESHTREEFQRALKLPTPLMGVNNRSLHSFEVSLNISLELVKELPPEKVLITESGIHTPEDIQWMQKHDIRRFLIGETLMAASDIGLKLTQLMKQHV